MAWEWIVLSIRRFDCGLKSRMIHNTIRSLCYGWYYGCLELAASLATVRWWTDTMPLVPKNLIRLGAHAWLGNGSSLEHSRSSVQ